VVVFSLPLLASLNEDLAQGVQCAWLQAFKPAQPCAAAGAEALERAEGGSRKRKRGDETEHARPLPPPCIQWTRQGYLRVRVPLGSVSPKHALHGVKVDAEADEAWKESVTLFRCIASKGQGECAQSLVECVPLSGRSHQIRLHLAYLGFPVEDDPVYCPAAAAAFEKLHAGHREAPAPAEAQHIDSEPRAELAGHATPLEASLVSVCVACSKGLQAAFSPLQLYGRGIKLHSCEYLASGEWHILAPVPEWAEDIVAVESSPL
jgi:RNA pseudouridylate synthase